MYTWCLSWSEICHCEIEEALSKAKSWAWKCTIKRSPAASRKSSGIAITQNLQLLQHLCDFACALTSNVSTWKTTSDEKQELELWVDFPSCQSHRRKILLQMSQNLESFHANPRHAQTVNAAAKQCCWTQATYNLTVVGCLDLLAQETRLGVMPLCS